MYTVGTQFGYHGDRYCCSPFARLPQLVSLPLGDEAAEGRRG